MLYIESYCPQTSETMTSRYREGSLSNKTVAQESYLASSTGFELTGTQEAGEAIEEVEVAWRGCAHWEEMRTEYKSQKHQH